MTQFSGLFDTVHGTGHAFVSQSTTKRMLSQLLKRPKNRALRELITTLVNGDVGDTAVATHSRVAAHEHDNFLTTGGVRTIETVADINRVTTAADVTEIDRNLFDATGEVYVVDKSGNGGGGKLGF